MFPDDHEPRNRYQKASQKRPGLEFSTILCSHIPINVIWRISEAESMSDAFSRSQHVVHLIENKRYRI